MVKVKEEWEIALEYFTTVPCPRCQGTTRAPYGQCNLCLAEKHPGYMLCDSSYDALMRGPWGQAFRCEG